MNTDQIPIGEKEEKLIIKQSENIIAQTKSDYHVFSRNATPIEIVYQGISCTRAKKKFNVHIFVQALFKINKLGISKLRLYEHISMPVSNILTTITFQYKTYSVDKIEKWYFKTGYKQTRIQWAIDKVNEILLTDKIPKIDHKRFYIQAITQYYPIYTMSLKKAQEWWKQTLTQNKKNDQLFIIWQKESIAWAVNNMDSPNTDIRGLAYKIILYQIDKSTFIKLGIIKDQNSQINIFDLLDNRKKIYDWFKTGAHQKYYPLPVW